MFALLISLTTVACGFIRSADDPRAMQRAGEQEFATFIARGRYRVVTEPALTEPVMRVAERIFEAARASSYAARARQLRWNVAVIDAPGVANAFATPGGRVVVFSGLFPVAQNEAGLAAVFGHEVAHVLEQHSLERRDLWARTSTLATLAGAVMGIAAGLATKSADAGSAVGQLVSAGTANVAAHAIVLPYSREQELAADRLGVELAARAGYDPREAVVVLKRLGAGETTRVPSRSSTHPDMPERLSALRAWSSNALILYRGDAPGAMALLPDPGPSEAEPAMPVPGLP